MTPAVFLADLRRAGFSLRSEAGKLLIAPSSKLTPAQVALIKQHRDALLLLLADEEAALSALADRAFLGQPVRGPTEQDRARADRAAEVGERRGNGVQSSLRLVVGGASGRGQGDRGETRPARPGKGEETGEGAEAEAGPAVRPGTAPGGDVGVWTGWIKMLGEPWRRLVAHEDRWECWRRLLDLRPGVDEASFELLVNEGQTPDHRRKPR